MSNLATLARPYAKAAFELAQADGALAAWSDMLALSGAMVAEPELARLLEKDLITVEEFNTAKRRLLKC